MPWTPILPLPQSANGPRHQTGVADPCPDGTCWLADKPLVKRCRGTVRPRCWLTNGEWTVAIKKSHA